VTPDPLGIRTELPVPAMQSKSSPQRHFCQRHEVARSFFQARRQKTFHSHPFPSQNANANENGRRIYDDSICFNLRRESGDSFLIALLLWIGLSSTVPWGFLTYEDLPAWDGKATVTETSSGCAG